MQLLLRKQRVFNETSAVRNILDVVPSKLPCSAVTMILLVALVFLLTCFSGLHIDSSGVSQMLFLLLR